MPNVSLYASVGAELTHYDVDVEGAALTRRDTVSLPANVQYVWPHASRRFLYVATSDSASGMGPAGNHAPCDGAAHRSDERRAGSAWRTDPPADAADPHGDRHSLGSIILVAFNNPSAVRVYRINADGTPGDEVAQPGPIDPGHLRAIRCVRRRTTGR